MRGEILDFDYNRGMGLIAGADGNRYSFTRLDLRNPAPVYPRMQVGFAAVGEQAHDIYVVAPVHMPINLSVEPYYGPIEPDLGLWGYFVRALTSGYARFDGRARRKEYWSFVLFTTLFWTVLAIVALIIAVGVGVQLNQQYASSQANDMAIVLLILIGLVLLLIWLALILPSLAVTVRRFHDIGQSGWILLLLIGLSLIPFVGFATWIVQLVMTCLDSQPGLNKYGPPPKTIWSLGVGPNR